MEPPMSRTKERVGGWRMVGRVIDVCMELLWQMVDFLKATYETFNYIKKKRLKNVFKTKIFFVQYWVIFWYLVLTLTDFENFVIANYCKPYLS